MKIHIDKTINVPSGFYCNGCYRKGYYNGSDDQAYCEEFYPFLDKAENGQHLKCEACLNACRESLIAR